MCDLYQLDKYLTDIENVYFHKRKEIRQKKEYQILLNK